MRAICSLSLSIALLLLTGCDRNHPIIEEMEAAYASVPPEKGATREERIKDVERKWKEKRERINRAVQKYLPPGMKAEEAFKLLRQFKDQGFEVREYRRDGHRIWPDGEFKPHHEDNRRYFQLHFANEVSGYSAKKDYATEFHLRTWFVKKHVAISFRVVNGSGVISAVTGNIEASGI